MTRNLTARLGWDLSPFDVKAHAVDRLGQRLVGVYEALCGEKMLATTLHPAPNGGLCLRCAQYIVTAAVTHPCWVRLPGDSRCHMLVPRSADPSCSSCRCGARTNPRSLRILRDGPHGLLCTRCILPDLNLSRRVEYPRPGVP